MLVIAALGGNELLRRGEPMTAAAQRVNAKTAATALAEIVQAGHQLVVTHGNGPQMSLLALQQAAYRPEYPYPLDILDAGTEGMIGKRMKQMDETSIDRTAMGRLAKALTFICGANNSLLSL